MPYGRPLLAKASTPATAGVSIATAAYGAGPRRRTNA